MRRGGDNVIEKIYNLGDAEDKLFCICFMAREMSWGFAIAGLQNMPFFLFAGFLDFAQNHIALEF
jgi:hypothetical protein